MSAAMSIHPNKAIASVLALAIVVLSSTLAAGPAVAGYPDRIVRIVVPFAPGGGTDVIARALAQEMARDLGGSSSSRTGRGRGPSSEPSLSRPAHPTATRC